VHQVRGADVPDTESQLSQADDEPNKPEVVGVLHFELSSLVLGPDYPATAISAEIGRVAIAAARVDQESALLLSGLHAGQRAAWDFEDLRRRGSAWLRDKSLDRVEELFEGELLENAHAVVLAAYFALDHRHVAMHSVWTLMGQDAVTPADDLVTALESSTPDAALAALVGRDIDSDGWRAVHPRTGGPGPAPVAELCGIRRELEQANNSLTELRFRLASALYAGRPCGARRVIDPTTGAPLT
jgi:hypothetical protein